MSLCLTLPAKIFVHLILVLHPRVCVHEELQEGEDSHEGEGDQRHCGETQRISACVCVYVSERLGLGAAPSWGSPVPPLAVDST